MHLGIDDNCLETFNQIKLHKASRNVSFKIDNEKIVMQRVGGREQGWNEFLEALPKNQFRYCVFDFEFTTTDNMHQSKLTFINWNPDEAPLKKKVLYATAKESFKTHLGLNTRDYTITSKNDMTFEDMVKELSK